MGRQNDPDHILATFNQQQVDYLLIGGMNFLLRHAPLLLTFDTDLWIEDSDANRARCEQALSALDAEWGPTDTSWMPVASFAPGWLTRQTMFSLHTAHGAVDIFRFVRGLSDWQVARQAASSERTVLGTPYWGISDHDMLQCQLALDVGLQRLDRIKVLRTQLNLPP